MAFVPLFTDWPVSFWFTQAWVSGQVNPPRFSLASFAGLEYTKTGLWANRLMPIIDHRTRLWAVSVPGGHQTIGALIDASGISVIAEAGLLSAKDGSGIRSWDAAETGLLPHQDIGAGFTRLSVWATPISMGSSRPITAIPPGRITSRQLQGLSIGFGRDKRFWSPLVLSGAPSDGLDLMADVGSFAFAFTLRELDTYTVDSTSWFKHQWVEPGTIINRFFIGKRLEWAPTENLSLHLCEGAVYSTLEGLPRLSALNPLYSMYLYQWTHSDDNNSVWAIGADYRRAGRFGLLWELLIDDLQYNPHYWSEVPPDLAWWAQIWLISGPWSLVIDHTGATAWVYNNSRPWDIYRLWDHSLGTQPDQVLNQVLVIRRLGQCWELSGRMWHRLKGSTTLNTPNPAVGEYPEDWFLRDSVEQQVLFYPGITWVNNRAWVKAELGLGSFTKATLSTGVLIWP